MALTKPIFATFEDAFSYCREADRPVSVRVQGEGTWNLFPSGKAEPADRLARRLQAAEALATALEPFANVWTSPERKYPLDEDYQRAAEALRKWEEANG